jgi:hypothetical protein
MSCNTTDVNLDFRPEYQRRGKRAVLAGSKGCQKGCREIVPARPADSPPSGVFRSASASGQLVWQVRRVTLVPPSREFPPIRVAESARPEWEKRLRQEGTHA